MHLNPWKILNEGPNGNIVGHLPYEGAAMPTD